MTPEWRASLLSRREALVAAIAGDRQQLRAIEEALAAERVQAQAELTVRAKARDQRTRGRVMRRARENPPRPALPRGDE